MFYFFTIEREREREKMSGEIKPAVEQEEYFLRSLRKEKIVILNDDMVKEEFKNEELSREMEYCKSSVTERELEMMDAIEKSKRRTEYLKNLTHFHFGEVIVGIQMYQVAITHSNNPSSHSIILSNNFSTTSCIFTSKSLSECIYVLSLFDKIIQAIQLLDWPEFKRTQEEVLKIVMTNAKKQEEEVKQQSMKD